MTTTEAIIRHADGIYEQGGLLWRAKPGATSTFEERVWAGAFYIELHQDAHWNPGARKKKPPNWSGRTPSWTSGDPPNLISSP